MCLGVFGQMIWMSWEHSMVIVKLSTWPDFTDTAKERATVAALHRIAEALA
jgi:CubicO group peptidase (beta-lactamase class C family)